MDPPLTLRMIRALPVLADARSLTGAAQVLNASPSALSRALAGAEAALGAPLFQRGWSGIDPTAAGEAVLPVCVRLLARIAAVERTALGLPPGPARVPVFLRWAHLRAVAAVVDMGGASGAAARLGVTQPAVSRLVAETAAALGAALFARRPNGLHATPQAKALAGLWAEAQAVLAGLPALLAERVVGMSGRVAVGMLPFSGQNAVMQAMGDLTRAHPALRLVAMPGSYALLTEALRRGEIDLIVGILRQPAPAGLVERPLTTEAFTLIASTDHPIHAGHVTIDRLAQARWIVGPHGTPIRRWFEALFTTFGARPPAQTCEIWSFAHAEQMIVESGSLALLSYGAGALAGLRPDLRKVEFALPDPLVPVGVTLREGAAPDAAVAAFLGLLSARLQSPSLA
ncbi:MAG: LysR family transcriptional regulator [Gemmobacter sp.]|nr:LysR family transcriptional regulator [Gemmobacter sp.]